MGPLYNKPVGRHTTSRLKANSAQPSTPKPRAIILKDSSQYHREKESERLKRAKTFRGEHHRKKTKQMKKSKEIITKLRDNERYIRYKKQTAKEEKRVRKSRKKERKKDRNRLRGSLSSFVIMAAAAPRRATIVQVKRKAHEAAAESLYIAAKRSKRNGEETADDKGNEGEEEREEPCAKRHVFRRVESLQQADIDRGGHFELLVSLTVENSKERTTKERRKKNGFASLSSSRLFCLHTPLLCIRLWLYGAIEEAKFYCTEWKLGVNVANAKISSLTFNLLNTFLRHLRPSCSSSLLRFTLSIVCWPE
jgi:hypothetical protein